MGVVDNAKRDLARTLILQLANGEITYLQFRDRYPTQGDAALSPLAAAIEGLFDDLPYDEPVVLVQSSRDALFRYAAFLGTELEYEWADLRPHCGLLTEMFTFDLLGRRHLARVRAHGDYEAWPFRYRR